MGNGKEEGRDFLGGPVVKMHTSTAGDAGSIPVRELRSHIHIAQPKKNKKILERGRQNSSYSKGAVYIIRQQNRVK